MPIRISLVICTYNRSDLLDHCLRACSELQSDPEVFEVLVIDNRSTDATPQIVQNWEGNVVGLRCIREEKQGLSHARNRGIEEAQSDWIYFIDDDAKVAPDFIERALACIEEVKPLVFGGTFAPWYHYGQPRWFKDHYASSDLRYPLRRVLPKGRFLTGCNFCVHRSVFERFGTFDPNLGMRGNLVGYGEETELQREIQAAGVAIWFDPALKMDHVVNAERLNVSWQIASGWALGRDRVRSGKVPRNPGYLTAVLITGLALTVVSASVNGLKLLAQRDYYKENWWIDTFRKAAKRAAVLYTASLE
jgi:glycosyltransferase involved in cell wall biosynthesis